MKAPLASRCWPRTDPGPETDGTRAETRKGRPMRRPFVFSSPPRTALFHILETAKAEVIVAVAVARHHLSAMPERRAPTAPMCMGANCIPDEPAPFHFGDAQLAAAAAGHLVGRERQIHVFGRVAVKVVNPQRAFAGREASGGIGVRPAAGETAAIAAGALEAAGGADARAPLLADAVAGAGLVLRIMRRARRLNAAAEEVIR